MKHKIVFLVFMLFVNLKMNAQCAMCRAVLESEESQTAAEGINDGIVFLMAIPYILVATITYFVYRTYNKSQKSKKIDEAL